MYLTAWRGACFWFFCLTTTYFKGFRINHSVNCTFSSKTNVSPLCYFVIHSSSFGSWRLTLFWALLLSEGDLHSLWIFCVWWIRFLQTFYPNNCIVTVATRLHIRCGLGHLEKSLSIMFGMFSKGHDYKVQNNKSFFIIYSVTASHPDCSGSHTVCMRMEQRENMCQ